MYIFRNLLYNFARGVNVMKERIRRYELTDDEWESICSLFPVREAGTKGRPYNDVRTTVNGIIWIARSGAPWRDLPERYGRWNTVYKCFAKWQEQGIFEKVFHELRIDADLQDIWRYSSVSCLSFVSSLSYSGNCFSWLKM